MKAEQQSERDLFEAWVLDTYNYGYSLTRSSEVEGAYVHDGTDMAWDAWQARAALSHPSTPQGWQDIESAPKDGTNVLLRDRGGHHADGYWLRSAYNGNGAWIWPFIHANPTHWQPLPPPPEQGSKG